MPKRSTVNEEIRVVRKWLDETPRDRGGRKPLGLTKGAYRPYRRDMVDNLDYAERLPPEAKAWLERFNREYYDADNRLLKSPFALHRDRLEWDSDAPIPTRWRKWWGRQMEVWPEVAAQALNSVVGEEVARVKHLRRDCYQLQNLAFRDAYAFKGVVHVEDDSQFRGDDASMGEH